MRFSVSEEEVKGDEDWFKLSSQLVTDLDIESVSRSTKLGPDNGLPLKPDKNKNIVKNE